MQTHLRMAYAALGGILIGAAIMRATHAQQVKESPAYVIAEVEKDPTKTEDPAAARRYADGAPKSLIPFGGQYVVRGGAVQTVELPSTAWRRRADGITRRRTRRSSRSGKAP